jgi:hypothetical protein
MAIPFRSWRPTKSEADLLIDMLTARLAPAKIAKTLYIDVRTLRDFLGRLEAVMDTPSPEWPLPQRPPRPATTPIIRAEAYFDKPE